MKIQALPAEKTLVGQKVNEDFLIFAAQIGRFDLPMFLQSGERNFDVLHTEKVMNLKPARIDRTISGEHDAYVVPHRFHGFWKAPGQIPDTPRRNKGIRLGCDKKDAQRFWHD